MIPDGGVPGYEIVRIGATAKVSTSLPDASTAFRSYVVPSGPATGVIVTVMSLETAPGANVTVARPSALVTLPPATAVTLIVLGGAVPLAVPVTGFGDVVAPVETVLDDASALVSTDVLVVVELPVPPLPVPVPLVPPVVPAVESSFPVPDAEIVPVVSPVVPEIVGGVLLLVSAPEIVDVPEAPVVAVCVCVLVCVCVIVGSSVPVSVVPIVAVCVWLCVSGGVPDCVCVCVGVLVVCGSDVELVVALAESVDVSPTL